jgi:hypothetical protein
MLRVPFLVLVQKITAPWGGTQPGGYRAIAEALWPIVSTAGYNQAGVLTLNCQRRSLVYEASSVVGWGAVLGRKVKGSSSDTSGFFNWFNQTHYDLVGSTEPLTQMSIRNSPEGKGRTLRKAHNLIAISERTIQKTFWFRRLSTQMASMTC